MKHYKSFKLCSRRLRVMCPCRENHRLIKWVMILWESRDKSKMFTEGLLVEQEKIWLYCTYDIELPSCKLLQWWLKISLVHGPGFIKCLKSDNCSIIIYFHMTQPWNATQCYNVTEDFSHLNNEKQSLQNVHMPVTWHLTKYPIKEKAIKVIKK